MGRNRSTEEVRELTNCLRQTLIDSLMGFVCVACEESKHGQDGDRAVNKDTHDSVLTQYILRQYPL